jgi:hypothetical protein
MIALVPMVVALALLVITLRIAKRYLTSMGLPAGWVSIPRIVRALWRATVGTIARLWRAGKAVSRFVQGRRSVRRLPSRASVGGPKGAR